MTPKKLESSGITMNTKICFVLALIIGLISISCIDKSGKADFKIKSGLTGQYSMEYSFTVEGEEKKYLQKGSVKPWSIEQDNEKIIVENIAVGVLKGSKLTFSGGPLNFGAGHGVANFTGIKTDSTIVGTFSGTYYDSKYGAGKFSSATFILRKIHED